MKMVQAVLDTIGQLMGADTTYLAEATPFVAVALVKMPFSPGPYLTFDDLTFADFDGSDPLHAVSAATQVFTDPANGEQIMQVQEHAGGWHWVVTGDTNLNQVIYGYALLNADGDALIAADLFDLPITLNAIGQGVDVPQVRFRITNLAIA